MGVSWGKREPSSVTLEGIVNRGEVWGDDISDLSDSIRCVCVCVCVQHIHSNVLHPPINQFKNLCMCVCVYVCTCVCDCVVSMCVWVCVCVCEYACVC